MSYVFLVSQVILARKKLDEWALILEYVVYMVMDTLNYPDFDSILAAVKMMSEDYANITKIKKKSSQLRKLGLS